jgi:hypothetical protein
VAECRHGESNSDFSLERAASWPLDDGGHKRSFEGDAGPILGQP